jgi:CBS domain-containing protein
VVVKGRNSSSTRVSEVMTPTASLVTVTPAHSVLDVMELMVVSHASHLPGRLPCLSANRLAARLPPPPLTPSRPPEPPQEKNFRHVPVVEEGAMAGMVSIR